MHCKEDTLKLGFKRQMGVSSYRSTKTNLSLGKNRGTTLWKEKQKSKQLSQRMKLIC